MQVSSQGFIIFTLYIQYLVGLQDQNIPVYIYIWVSFSQSVEFGMNETCR